MSLLKALKSDASIKNEADSLGGGSVMESGAYLSTITMAYVEKSSGGAMGLFLTLKTDAGKQLKQTLWMTSGTAKGGLNYYEKDGVKNYLPGYNAANSLCLLTLGKEVSEMDTEEKVVKIYNFEAKSEIPTKVQVIVDLIGKQIIAGVVKQTVDKNVKNDAGDYVATGETRDENDIDKFFRAEDKMTTAELRAKATEAGFYNDWTTKNTGITRNKAKGGTGVAGAPKAGATTMAKPSKSLFG